MSFLYKALLKNGEGPVSNQSQPALGEHSHSPTMTIAPQPTMPMFADTGSTKIPGYVWLLVGILLLVVGLLSGYILGQQQFTLNTSNLAQVSQTQNAVVDNQVDVTATPKVQNPVSSIIKTEAQEQSQDNQIGRSEEGVNALVSTNPSSELVTTEVAAVNTESSNTEVIIGEKPMVFEQSSVSQQDVEADEVKELNSMTSVTLEESAVELDVADVPEALKSKFALAVEATEELPDTEFLGAHVSSESSLTGINDLSAAEKAGIPPLYFGMHIFASDPKERWVKINNRVLREGDEYMPGMRLLEIRQDMVVWETRYSRFAQEALEDFAG